MNYHFMKNYKKQAENLVKQLEIKCSYKTIKENYGQKEIKKFIDKISKESEYNNLAYSEQCDIKDILYKVSSITPHN